MSTKQAILFWFCLALFVASVIFTPWEVKYTHAYWNGYSPLFVTPHTYDANFGNGQANIKTGVLFSEWVAILILYAAVSLGLKKNFESALPRPSTVGKVCAWAIAVGFLCYGLATLYHVRTDTAPKRDVFDKLAN